MPIEWMQWGPEAFERAQRENKLILLAIGATWCHWCHRMDHDTYDVPEIQEKVNEHFVPVKVDTDRRPDVNDRYNMGGWPTTALLTPKGELVAGGTYIPAHQMSLFLDNVKDAFEKKGDKIEKYAGNEPPKRSPEDAGVAMINQFKEMVAFYYDPAYGGFGESMKFPQPDLLSLVCTFAETGDKKMLSILEKTLVAMGDLGLYDHEEGGFFRYCTQRNWQIPHYEKMLEDNVKIIDVFLRVYVLTGNEYYKNKAKHALDYVMKNLYDGKAFHGSQDADEDYYLRKLSERKVEKAPFIDKTFYTNWNCFASITLLHASVVFGEEYKAQGVRTMDFVSNNLFSGGKLRHFFTEKPEGPCVFADYAALIEALLETHKFTMDWKYLNLARETAETTKKLFMDSDMLFFDSLPDLGLLSQRMKKIDDNGSMALSLAKLGFIDNMQNEHCKKILGLFAGEAKTGSLYASRYVEAAFLCHGNATEIVFSKEDEETRKATADINSMLSKRTLVKTEGSINAPFAVVCKGSDCRKAGSAKELSALLREKVL